MNLKIETLPYQFIDSGEHRKLERFGAFLIDRPAPSAIWKKNLPLKLWQSADLIFNRQELNRWQTNGSIPSQWITQLDQLLFKIMPTDFGHLGLFPEHHFFWEWIRATLKKAASTSLKKPNLLNLFAYSGGATLAAAQAGAEVCHLDASKGMIAWAIENAKLNHLEKAPIRWIIDDVMKFLKREIKRGKKYEGIILDPPSFGRGNKGELFKIEEQLIPLLEACKELLSEQPLFLILSCHTPSFTPLSLAQLLRQIVGDLGGEIDSGEMALKSAEQTFILPSGAFARWQNV